MLTWFIERVFFAESPLVWFLLLVVLTHVIYYYGFKQDLPSVMGSSLVMALGLFAAYVLPHFEAPLWLMTLCALELMIIWLYFLVNSLQAVAQDESFFLLRTDQYRLGCWVAGTAITGLLLEEADPLLYGCIIMLALISLVCWGVHWRLLWREWSRPCFKKPATGKMLLPTIGTFAVLLLAMELFHDDMPFWMDDVVVILSIAMALWDGMRLASYWFVRQSRYAVVGWPNSNGLIYGMFATLGLVIVESGAFSSSLILGLWCITFALFVTMSSLDLARACLRIQAAGWKQGVLTYHPSQWLRVYSWVAMFAFTNEVWRQTPTLSALIQAISTHGQWVIALLVMVEVILAVRASTVWPK